jgi:hypothetical protein
MPSEDWEDIACPSNLQSVEISDSVVITCSSEWCVYKWSTNPFYSPYHIYSHTHTRDNMHAPLSSSSANIHFVLSRLFNDAVSIETIHRR